jgi:hypothetical protein
MCIVRTGRAAAKECDTAEERDFVMDRALARAAAVDWYTPDGLAVVNSGAGLEYRLWLSLRHKQPAMALSGVAELLPTPENKLAILDAFNLTKTTAKKNDSSGPAATR